MARGGPDGGRAEDGGVEADHVVALLDHGAPPRVLDVAQHVDAERPVVVGGAEAAVDLGRGEDEAPVAAEAHHLLHQVVAGGAARLGHRCRIPERILALTSLASRRPRTVSTARPVLVDHETVELLGALEAVPGHAAPGAQGQGERLELALVGRQLLAPALGRAPGLDGGQVALGRAHVPPAHPGAVRVGGRADAEIVALLPVEVVVPALVAGAGPVGDLLPAVAGGLEHGVGPLVAPGQRVLVGVAPRVAWPAACPARRSGRRR